MSLHPLNALDATPIELVGFASRLAVPFVCLFTHVPEAARGRYPQVTLENVSSVQSALADSDVRLCNLEVFPLDRDGSRDDLRVGLDIGARLGATKATAHLHETGSEQQARERFGDFAELAEEYGIVAGLEFNNFSSVRDIITATRIVRSAGIGSLVLDTLHLVRGGYDPADVEAASDLIGYAQLSDGPLELAVERRWREAVSERLPPGDGEFPLIEMLRPISTDAIFEVEVPQSTGMKSGVSPYDRAKRSVEAGRAILAVLNDECTK